MCKEEFFFDSHDGISKIHAVRYTPDTDKVSCVVQIVHGMAEFMERYEEFAFFLAEHGVVVTGEDHLGHGKTVPEGGIRGYFCEHNPATVVVEDVHRLKEMTRALYPNVPYVMIGHSMGSFIVRNYMFSYGTEIDGAILMGTGMPSPALMKLAGGIAAVQKRLVGAKHVSKFLHACTFGTYNRRVPFPKTVIDWFTKDEKRVAAYMADSRCGFIFTVNGFQTLFELIMRLHRKDNLVRVPKKLPVLILSGEDDPVGDYGKGVHRSYESLKAAGVQNIQLKLYEKDRHELLHETDRAVVMQDIYDWIRGTILV